MRDKLSGIYGIENVESGKWYVGQSADIHKRWNDHKWLLNMGKHKNKHLQSAWNKRGEGAFVFHILELCDQKDINEREQAWIKSKNSHTNGYNKTDGGEGLKNWTAPEWYRAQRSQMYSGEKNPFYGRKHTEETRSKLRETHRGERHVNYGKHLSEETRAKISEAHKGMKHTEETKRKLSEINKGKAFPQTAIEKSRQKAMSPENHLNKAVVCITTGEWFYSAAEAARRTGLERTKISACCRGDRKTTKGTEWKFAQGGPNEPGKTV